MEDSMTGYQHSNSNNQQTFPGQVSDFISSNRNFYCVPNDNKTPINNHASNQYHQLPQQQPQQLQERLGSCYNDIVGAWHIKDDVLPMPNKLDKFQLWPNGYQQLVYDSAHPEASAHQSGWAMRNTNNHDSTRLKKSCLGVMLCSINCRGTKGQRDKVDSNLSSSAKLEQHGGTAYELEKKRSGGGSTGSDGGNGGSCGSDAARESPLVHVRPFICDKARGKQKGLPCPTPGCEGLLVQVKCTGHGGKPVTHVWRSVGGVVYFQCKGVHDHPRPDPKSSSVGKKKAKPQGVEERNDDDEEMISRKRRQTTEKQWSDRKVKPKKARRSNAETTEVSSTTVDCGSMLIGSGIAEFPPKRKDLPVERMSQYFQAPMNPVCGSSSLSVPRRPAQFYFTPRFSELPPQAKEPAYYKNSELNYLDHQHGGPISSSDSLYANKLDVLQERKTSSADKNMPHPSYSYYDFYNADHHKLQSSDYNCFGDQSYQQRRPHSNQSAYDYQHRYHQMNFSTPSSACSSLTLAETTTDWSRVWSHSVDYNSTLRSTYSPSYSVFNSYDANPPDLNSDYVTLGSHHSVFKNQCSLPLVNPSQPQPSVGLNDYEIQDQRAANASHHHPYLFVGPSQQFDNLESSLARTKSESGTYF